MDVGAVAIGGVSLVFLVPGLVEFAKKLGVRGKWCVVLAFCLAALFGGTWAAIDAGLMPVGAAPWVRVAVIGLGCGVVGLAVTGYYDLSAKLVARFVNAWAAFPAEVAHRPKGE